MRKSILKKITSIKQTRGEVILTTNQGNIRVKPLFDNCIWVTWYPDGKIPVQHHSWAVEKPIKPTCNYTMSRKGGITISTKEVTLKILSNPVRFAFYNAGGTLISTDKEIGFQDKEILCTKNVNREEAFYGLGEKTGTLNKRGNKYLMWNTDDWVHTPTKDPLYKTIPFIICLNNNNAYGFFFDDVSRSRFEVGSIKPDQLSYTSGGDMLNYYFIQGPSIARVTKTYSDLTGRIPMPAKWALGHHQSRWSYYTEQEALGVAKLMRKKKIPCDVIHLDIDYMDGYRVFTWNKKDYRNHAKTVKTLTKMGYKVVCIVDPGVKHGDEKYNVFTEGRKKNYFCKYPDGRLFVGKVWPGEAVFPDFTNPKVRKWWGNLHRFYKNSGISGIWNDMNEPASSHIKDGNLLTHTMDFEVMQHNTGKPTPHEKIHNVYGSLMTKATADGFRAIDRNKRYFLLTRSAYAGIQKYSSVWLGDNCSWWEHIYASIHMLANIGMSGVPFAGVDIGGFGNNCNGELLSRWIQMGAFLPFCRNHTARRTVHQEPWSFGKQCEDIYRKYMQLRYRLMPYIYSQFRKAQKDATPVLKPLVYEYQTDKTTYNLSDQYLFGDSFLVAPVYNPNKFARSVYLPEGTWIDYWKQYVMSGKQHILAAAPLEQLPLYVKSGSIIPMYPEHEYMGQKKIEELILDVYPDESESETVWYEDDGTSYDYERGKYSETKFTCRHANGVLTLNIKPLHSGYNTKIKYITAVCNLMYYPPDSISINGKPVRKGYNYDMNTRKLTLRIPFTGKNTKVEVKI